MGIEKMGSLEGRAIRNGRAIDMQWLRENEVNEMRTSHDVDETKDSSDYIDPESVPHAPCSRSLWDRCQSHWAL